MSERVLHRTQRGRALTFCKIQLDGPSRGGCSQRAKTSKTLAGEHHHGHPQAFLTALRLLGFYLLSCLFLRLQGSLCDTVRDRVRDLEGGGYAYKSHGRNTYYWPSTNPTAQIVHRY
eukprot:2923489-Rhodomonas_salina.1